jgi:mannose-6-phosphate isomerase
MGILSKLTPHLTRKIWGGEKLASIKQITTSDEDLALGETWEVSTHKDGSSKIGDKLLCDLTDLSYLVKFIDTSDNLSVQVHPTDEYAKANENSKGKTECWIILEAQPGCGIYLGFKKGITKKEFKTAIENNLDVEKYLNYFEVSPGDYFYVPSGSVHAIGLGVTLAEVQQSSGITYRVWDWNRVDNQGKSRELHIDKAMDVLNFNQEFNLNLLKTNNLFQSLGTNQFVKHADFKSTLISLNSDKEIEINLTSKESLSILEGEVEIDSIKYSKFESGITLNSAMVKIKATKNSKILLVRE